MRYHLTLKSRNTQTMTQVTSYTKLREGRAGLRICDNGWRYVRTYHPYDLSEYHYAASQDGEHWSICLDSSVVATFSGTAEDVVDVLREHDRAIAPRIDKS